MNWLIPFAAMIAVGVFTTLTFVWLAATGESR